MVGPRQRDEDETGSSVYETSDFESIEYEGANPTRGFDPSGGLVRDRQDVTVRGYPLFPVDNNRPWEYWIYPSVGDGIEVVFLALNVGAPMDFPIPPQGRGRGNDIVWRQRSPENVVASATKRQSEAFVDQTATLDIWMEEADFLRDGKRSRFEVYFGVPT